MTGEMQIVAQVLAVLLSPFVVQLLKGTFGLKGDAALYLAYVVAIALGGLVAAIGGVLPPLPGGDPLRFVIVLGQYAAVVAAVGEFIYQVWLSKLQGGLFANRK